MSIEQFSLTFNKYKHEMCRNGRKVEYIFDKVSSFGLAVSQHEGPDDEEGERVDMKPRGDGVFSYQVHPGNTIVVRLGLQKDATKKVLTPKVVWADGVEEAYPPFELFAGENYQLPNLEMDPDEGPNFWILKENDEVVLTIMIHVEN